jgi:WD40 repeat protein
MGSLRVRCAGTGEGHGGEVFSCAYSPDGAFVLSAGWDGCLRLWLTSNGQQVSCLHASAKPLSCCILSRDGTEWLSGSMDGALSRWDAVSHQLKQNILAHIRPISAIAYSPDGQWLATASWDRKIIVRRVGHEATEFPLAGHHDIVSGCRWTPDGKQLISWSHDGTLRVWDMEIRREAARLRGHEARVTVACLSADGHWAVSGGQDGTVKLWDLQRRAEVRAVRLKAEVRGCWCLRDGGSIVTVTADGWLVLWSLPDFEVRSELAGDIKVMCGEVAPTGAEIALGSSDGRIHLLTVEGIEESPILVRPMQTLKPKTGMFGRILGKPTQEKTFQYTCPACRKTSELPNLPSEAILCASCKQPLRLSAEALQLQPQ